MIIGITGSLATGTSTAAKYIASSLKAELIDADKIAHLALGKGKDTYKAVVKAFGRSILKSDSAIDKDRLAKIAFSNKKNLSKLSNILHPFVIDDIMTRIDKIYKKNKNAFVIVDGPVIIESKFYKDCDLLIVVSSSLALQLERAASRKNLKLQNVLIRIQYQMPLHRKVRYADYIIDNGGSLKELQTKCKEVVSQLKKEKKI